MDSRIGEIRTYESEHGLVIVAGSTLTLDTYAIELSERFECELDLRVSLSVVSAAHGKVVASLKKLYLGDGESVLLPRTRGLIVAEVEGVTYGPLGVKHLCERVLKTDRRSNYRSQWSGKPIKMADGRWVRFYPYIEGEEARFL